jgi:hypothetical protein
MAINNSYVLELRNRLSELKLAQKNPRIFLTNYFNEFRNKIDTECQEVLTNKEKSCHEIWYYQALETQDLIIKEVNAFEQSCLRNMATNQLTNELSRSLANAISKIENKLECADELNDDGIYEIFELSLNASILVQKELFNNRSIIYFNAMQLIKYKNFGFLLIINNTYVDQYIMDLLDK